MYQVTRGPGCPYLQIHFLTDSVSSLPDPLVHDDLLNDRGLQQKYGYRAAWPKIEEHIFIITYHTDWQRKPTSKKTYPCLALPISKHLFCQSADTIAGFHVRQCRCRLFHWGFRFSWSTIFLDVRRAVL